MKHYILLILAIIIGTRTQARQRSLEEMCQVAGNILPQQAACVRGANGDILPPQLQVMGNAKGFKVIGYPQGGFALVANDDRVEALLGYSPQAIYDSTCVPDGLQWYITSLEQVLATRPHYDRSSTADYNVTGVPAVQPMLTAKWGQDAPYNLQCPKKLKGSGNMVTGCVATAMAQIMHHYQWPLQGDGELIYNFAGHVYANFAATRYDWANMLPEYQAGRYNNTQAQAVAQLMMHCGVAVNMRYDDVSSGAQGQFAALALRSNFRYHPNVGYRNRANHTNVEWMSSIYRELAAGRPILYTGQDSKMSYGHAFIFDGYDSDGLVHVNWGWEGMYDGYFDINLLNSGYMGLEFTDLQAMIVGIAMPDDDIPHSVEMAIRQDLDLYTTANARVFTLDTSNLPIYNLNDYDLAGTIAMVLNTSTGPRVLSTIETFTSDDPFQSFTYLLPQYEQYTITIPLGLPNGNYFFYLAFREEGRDEWQPLYAAEGVVSYFMLTKQGSTYTVGGIQGNYVTAIDTPHEAIPAKKESHLYNIAGMRVNQLHHGIVIDNGKKTLRPIR